VSDFVALSTLEAAYQVASNLRQDDYRECVEGHGVEPKYAIPLLSLRGKCYTFVVPDGTLAGIAGITDDCEVWMLCTSRIHEYPLTFAREAKRFIEGRSEPYLWCRCDARNTTHLKLLRFLGFKKQREIYFGPNNLKFIELDYVITSVATGISSRDI
jgi:hypothetical protein